MIADSEVLKRVRIKRGWSQGQMANYFGIQREMVTFWETDKRKIPIKIVKKMRKLMRASKGVILQELTLKNVTKSAVTSILPIEGYTSEKSLLHSLGEKHTQKGGVSDLKQDNADIPVEETVEYHLLDGLIAFKRSNNNRYPTTQDFNDGKIKSFSLTEIKEHYGSLKEAKKVATELRKQRRQEKKDPVKLRGLSNRCPICGQPYRGVVQLYEDLRSWISLILQSAKGDSYQNILVDIRDKILFPKECFCGGKPSQGWNSSLRIVLGMRFEALLKTNNTNKTCQEAVQDSKKAVFGTI